MSSQLRAPIVSQLPNSRWDEFLPGRVSGWNVGYIQIFGR